MSLIVLCQTTKGLKICLRSCSPNYSFHFCPFSIYPSRPRWKVNAEVSLSHNKKKPRALSELKKMRGPYVPVPQEHFFRRDHTFLPKNGDIHISHQSPVH